MSKLTKKQLEEVKKQLIKQAENFPKEQKNSMISQISKMNDDQLEEFLEKNKLLNINHEEQSPFRMIVENKLSSFKIAENDKAIAVLEINPISEGHVMIIPKIPYKASEIPEEIQRFAQLLAAHLNKILTPKDIQIAVSEMFEEAIINILPIYKNESFESKRKKSSEKELANLQEKLTLPPQGKEKVEVIKLPDEIEEETEYEDDKKSEAKKRKIPINKLQKAPKRFP